jgi:Outer membrane protein beta-barrel domain
MSLRGVLPLPRRAAFLAFSAVFAASMIASSAASAQAHFTDSDSFASSSEGIAVEGASPLPATPSASEGQSGSYGYHQRNWSNHLTFEGGGGFNAPTSDSSSYVTWGGNFTVGGGYKFTDRISLLAEYQFIDDKLPGALIGETGATGGNAHIWSLTLDPVVDLFPKRKNDVYITGGGGFYRKVTNFTDPEEVQFCDVFFCEGGTETEVVGHFSSNQGGWNVGAGFTHKLGGFTGDGRTKLFAEVRYLDILTPEVNGSPNDLGAAAIAADTKLVPVTFGIRW